MTKSKTPETAASELLPPGYGVNAAGEVVKMPDSTETPIQAALRAEREKHRSRL